MSLSTPRGTEQSRRSKIVQGPGDETKEPRPWNSPSGGRARPVQLPLCVSHSAAGSQPEGSTKRFSRRTLLRQLPSLGRNPRATRLLSSPQPSSQEPNRTVNPLRPAIDPWVGPLARAYLAGDHRDLLSPLRWLDAPADPPKPTIRSEQEHEDRARLARSLRAANEELDHPRASEYADRLADATTEVVVTGQQAGLFGGPLYALNKALAATLWARRLTAAGRPCVPVFWVASEDHDFDEVRSADLGWRTVAIAALEETTTPVALRTIDRRLAREIAAAVSECAASLDAPPLLEQAMEMARECYREGESWARGFERLLVRLLDDDCPLILDSTDPVLRRLQAPRVGALLERLPQAIEGLAARERRIHDAGFGLQVTSLRGDDGEVALPFFLLRDGCRHRVVTEPGDRATTYRLRGHEESGSLEDLRSALEDEPESLSPSALLRPVLQDAALGTTLQILGPGEIAYVGQAAPLYGVLEVEAPTIALRPQAVVMPRRLGEHLGAIVESGLEARTLLGPWQGLEPELARRADSGALDALESARREIEQALARVTPQAVALDPTLQAPCEKTRDHVARGLDVLGSKIEHMAAQQIGVLRGRIERIRDFVVPGGRLQERKLCSLWLVAQFGPEAVRDLAAALDLDPRHLQFVLLDAPPRGVS